MVGRVDVGGLVDGNRFGIAGDQLAAEQGLERFGQLDADIVLFEVDLLEERLVEQATHAAGGGQIARVAVAGVVQCSAQVVLHDLDVEQAGLQAGLDVCQLFSDAVLFLLHQVERDRSGVVSLEQLAALIEQPSLLLVQFPCLSICGVAACRRFGAEAGFDLLAHGGGQPLRPVPRHGRSARPGAGSR
ncbi:hypothetical protein ACWDNI_34625 [Nocardia niigatensis]